MDRVTVVDRPDAGATGGHYVSNRPPLRPRPLIKLPIGAITPRGWLRTQLELMRDGFVGHLPEISKFCRDDSAWLKPRAELGWEEVPYWLKGFGDLGYVLEDERIIAEAKRWIDAAVDSQQPDGHFGPAANKDKRDGWPNMIMLYSLRSRHEATGDRRIIPMMQRYFQWRAGLTDKELFPHPWGKGRYNLRWWQHVRAADELESLYWLYNRTGDKSLLELAQRIYPLMADWNDNVPSWHGVNICQGFRAPAVFFQQSGDAALIDGAMQSLEQVLGIYGRAPGGMFAADENCREGYTDPRQAAETCSMVELMHSYEYLLGITGDVDLADRCEDVAFNSLPASMTPDLKALHYLTAPNMVQLDRKTKAPGLQNGGCMLAFSPHRYRCCQHNVAMGWPYYAEHLWMATPDGGLAVVFYCENEVSAKVGADGREVRIVEKTDYPFDETVRFDVSIGKPTRFPLALRIPGWCRDASVRVNGNRLKVAARPRAYVIIDRTWAEGDKVELRLPMNIAVRTWTGNMNAVSVSRGPLTYSLKIGEKWVKFDDRVRRDFTDRDKWPAYEVLPTTPWNYGLVLDERDPASSFRFVRKKGPIAKQPFTVDDAPVAMVARGKRITAWTTDRHDLVGKLQQSPARAETDNIETITLIPMGCARLRISAFPTVSDAESAHVWTPPPVVPHRASHEFDDIAALSDGRRPAHSNDHDIPRFTWWPRKGTTEWVTYEFDEPRDASEVHVYWFDDTGRGFCRVPQRWRLLYRSGRSWKPVVPDGAAGTERDKFNGLRFQTIKTNALKLEVDLQPGMSGGILEWTVGPRGPS